MIKKIAVLAAMLLCSVALAQVDTAWTRRYSSPGNVSDYAYVMTTDASGNVYAAGSHTIATQSSNLLVKKYDTNGTELWTHEFNSGNYAERASSITVGPSGNVYVCGYTMGTGSGDYVTIKINGTTGDSLWTRIYDLPGATTGYDFARKVAIDALENVYVTGYGSRPGMGTSDIGTISYDVNGNFRWEAFYDGGIAGTDQAYALFVNATGVYVTGYSAGSGTGNDMVTIKYNAATGSEIWAKRYNGTADGADYGRDVVADASGNVYVTSSVSNTGTSTDITTIKYNSSGDTLWLRTYNGPDNASDGGYWIRLDGAGNVYVYGTTYTTATTNGQDLCLIKYDNNGNQQWVTTYNGPAMVGTSPSYENCPDETGQDAMVLDASANIYVTGRSTFMNASLTSHTDILTLKYNSSGVLQWEARYNHPVQDSIHQGQSVGLDNANNVYVAGYGRGVGTYIDWAMIKYTQGAPSSYMINAFAFGPGTITPSGAVVVNSGADTAFVISPNPGARLDSLVVDNVNHGSDSTYYWFYNVTADHTIKAYFSFTQFAGVKTVGVGGDYPTLSAAMAGWKDSIIAGDVIFLLTDSVYNSETYPIRCTIPAGYLGGDWTLTIKPVSGMMAKFEGSNATTMFDLIGIDRLIIDSLIISNRNQDLDTAGHAVRFINGASFNTIKNCKLLAACKLVSSLAGGVVYFATAEAPSGPGNNDNLIENCIVTSSRTDQYPVYAITIRGTSRARGNNNNTIKRCKIYDFSSTGIYFSAFDSNTTIHGNELYSTVSHNTLLMTGIRITATSVVNTKITGNKFFDFMAVDACTAFQAIYMTMADPDEPPLIANNFISLDGNVTHPNTKIYGIRFLRQQTTAGTYKFYYNSIYIGGTPTSKSSYGFFCKPSATLQTKIDFRNNIIFNNRSGGSGQHFCIYDSLASGASFISDYNDLYVATPGANGQYVAHRAGIDLATLADWQNVTYRDSHSISLNPNFISPIDLHIHPASTNVNNLATPISQVTVDIDGEPRDPVTPDIGADEYTPTNVRLIIATAVGPGTITPSGTITVTYGADTTFIIAPNINCQIDSLVVDNINHEADSTYYTFYNVTTDHTISAYFSPVVDIEEPDNDYPLLSLQRIYPNPFKNQTTIQYQLTKSAPVRIKIYNCLG
ncbi:MAG: hypothetical protein KGZ86_05930, partial [Candidatus Latescibacteria bacterium]|nr:hypothetical protein [Candidatus Latescibacterota bacterium]